VAENRFLQSPIDKLIEESKSYELPKIELPERSEPRSAAQSMRTSGLMPPQNFQPIFEEASAEYGVPLNVLAALGQQESSYNPSAVGARTKWGRAKGLMQYLDSTASSLGINPFDAKQSIHAAAKQLRERLDKGYTLEEAIMAHHGGDDRRQWGPKTRQYVQDVMGKAGKIGQGFMQNAQASAEEAEEFDLSAIQAELDAKEPGRYKVVMPGQEPPSPLRPDVQQEMIKTGADPVEAAKAVAATTPQSAPAAQTPAVQTQAQETPDDGGMLSDAGNLLWMGTTSAAQNLRELVSRIPVVGESIVRAGDAADRWLQGKDSETLLRESIEASRKDLTPEQSQALNKAWWDSEKGTFGPAWSDPRAYAGGIIQSLPETVLTMGAAGRLAKASYLRAIAKGGSQAAAATAAARTATIAGGVTEGLMGGAGTARQVRDEIMKLKPEDLVKSEAIQSLMSEGMSLEAARAQLAEDAATQGFLIAGTATGLFGGLGDRALANLITGRVSANLAGRVAKGAVAEGIFEELPQSMAQKAAENYAVSKADPNRKIGEGVVNEGLGGLAVGGVMGGAMGGAAYQRTETEQPQERVEPTLGEVADPTATPGPTQSDTTPQSAAPATPASEAPQQVPPAAVNDNAAPAAQQAAPQPPKGPLSRAAERVIQQSGEPVTVVAPDGEVAGTLESYVDQGNGRWTARVTAEDGNTYDFTHEDGVDIVRSQTAAQPEPEAIEEASAIEEPAAVEQPAMPEQGAADTAPVVNPQLTTEQPSSQRTPLLSERIQAEAEKGLDQMSEAELRGELKAVAKQAKELEITKESPREVRNEHARLTKRRKAIEQAINALTRPKQEEPVSAAKEIVERPKVEPTNSLQGEPASWVIRNKETGEVIMETFDKKKVDALNTEKYEAVPIQQHLGELNQKIKAGDEATVKESLTAGQPASAPQVGQAVVLGKGRQQGTITDVGDGFVKVKMGTRTEKMDMSTFNRRMAAAGDQAQPAPRRGEVGGMLAAGEVVTTSSGRQTTPFPKIDVDGNRKAVNTIKRVDQWLMQNAIDEARARGDEFNARQFEANLGRPSQADKDSAEEYLFGEQPPVIRSTLKPLVRDEAESAERPAESDNKPVTTKKVGDGITAGSKRQPIVETADAYADRVRSIAREFSGTYSGRSMAPLAADIAEHAIANNRRLTDAEIAGLAEKHEIPADVVEQLVGQPFSFDGIKGAAERGEPGAIALRKAAKPVTTKKVGDGITATVIDPSVMRQPAAEQKPAAEQAVTKPAEYGASNKLVTADRAAELRAKLKAKLNGSQLNSGIDPEILAMGTELAVFHIEAGVRRFAEFARTMAADLDMPLEKVRPYLRSWYNGARDMIEDSGLSIEGMDGPDEVRAALRQLDAGDTAPAAPAAKRETVSTPAGREFEVKHKVIEADELVTSNDATGAINPDYPKELQPRDRSRSASLDQINDIASKLNPRLLGESASATDGAPIVSPDNVVESGNGRTLAIRQAYARGMADRYREWLASQGYDVAGMKAPVLVRERVTPMSMEERIAYTTEANDRTTLELSSTERALSDARKMGPILHLYRGGDLQAAANRDFVRAFVGDVAAKADRGRILDGDGMLSQDGRRRIEAALLGSAYGDETLITDLFESADTDIKAIGGALLDVAGSWAKMREDAREGVISESVDTTPNLLEAVNLIRRARAEGRPILELVRQNDFFSGELDPVTLGFMSIFYRGESFTRARGRDKVADALRYYTEQAQLSQPGTNMFGEPEVTGAEILRGTNDRLQRQEQQAGQQQDIFASPRTDGENAGAPGGNGQGPQPEAAGQAPAQGGLNAPGSRERVERDRPDAGAAQPVVQAADGDAAGQDAEGAGQAGRGADGEQGAGQRDQRLPGDGATAGRERGDQPAYRADGQFQPESSTAGDPERTGSGGDSIQGQIVEQEREEAVADDAQAPGAGDLDQRLAAQRKAQNAPTKWGDKASIDAALPLLLPEQRDDVLKAEQRLAGHNGILYTNGTGTGKTATGLGVAKRFINDGKDNIVIVVPSDKIASDWVKFARMLGVELKQLADTNDNGKTGPIVTTYANFGQNESLAQRDWDLVIADESHYLSSNEGGDKTAALEQLRALTGHHAGFYRWVRQRHAKEWQAFSAAMQDRADANGNPDVPMERYIALEAAEAKAREKWNAIEQPAREKWNQRWAKQESLPKTVMLSATPFAYAKNVDYAEGYLFHYVEPADLLKSQGNVGGYNSGSPRDRFLMQHFGYRMRYNKLTAPESGVNSQLMEQQFNQWLKSTGALSGRRLEVAHDYDRKFVLVDDAVGTKIDEGLKYLREAEEGRYREVYEAVSKQFDYQRRMYLLESMKARAAVPIIREHLALGRKIVVFHDFNKGGGFNPFQDAIREIADPDVKSLARSVLGKPMFKLDFSGLFSPIETLGEAFPDALFFNGTVSKGQRRANADLFNDDDSGRNLIVVQSDAGREGVSLHDTTGKHQRVEINLGMPVKPVAATQIEGRIYRTGQASDAIFRYLTTGTAWEAAAFASKIAERASTAENLALGEEARGLKEAFIDAYQNADAFPASAEDGKGGKDYDRKLSAAFTTSPFDRAKTFYWAQQKNSKRRDQREGQDYFATPEPVGFKMVEWANIQPNDKALEPSAGHGAIARFFPEQSDVTMVEPSYELSQRAALANGNARIVNDRFEQLHINNKFDAIVMNPPYGSGGKTSTEHLAKAAKHLRDGGRIVALIPRGGLADKRLDAFLESEEAADLYTVAKIAMPAVTFERAGTAVNTQVLVLEKHANAADAEGILQRNIDLSNAESVNELFDRLESLSLPDRQPTSTPEPKQEIIEHTTAKGKVLRGIIRTDLTQDAAKEIDPYTFRKKNAAGETGWFIRAKHLDQGPRYSVAAEADRNLIAIHNLSAENLAFADKIGGIAVPSIGVVTTEAGGVDGFGEITLIGTKDLGDPRQEPVFSADAYTVRFPKPEFRKAKIKDADAILKPLKPISEEFDDRRVMDSFDAMVNRGDGSRAIDDWMSSPAAMAMFLREKGHDVKPAMRDTTLDSPFTPADILGMEELINKANRYAELDQNEAPEVAEVERLLDEAIDKKYAKRPALAGKVKERLMGRPGWAAFTLKGDLQKAKRGPDVDPWETRTQVSRLLEENNLELEFKQWVEGKILPVMGEPLLTVGRKKVPYTLDNIVDVMTRGPVRGQEKTMAFGAGNARAASSIEFSDVEQMRKAAAESIVDPQQYEEAKKVTEKLLDQYRDAAIKFTQHTTWDGRPDTFEALDASMRAIAKFSTKKKRDRAAMEAALKSEKFDVAAMKAAAGGAATVDKSLIQSIEAEIQKWAGRLQKLEPGDSRIPEVERRLKQNQDALQEELAKAADHAPRDPIGLAMLAAEALLNAPVPYFEAKPQRAVSLNEFAGAVVPKNLPAEARAILKKNGIEIVEYEGDRLKAVREAANKLHEQRGDIRYSVQDGEAPLSVNQVRAAITRGPFGVIVDKMVEKGLIVIHSNSSTLPKDMGRGKRGVQAVTEPGGKVHLVASNLTQQNANAVLLHEMFHSVVESLVGSKRWADLQGRLGSLYRQAERSSGKAREIFDLARARVADAKAQGAVTRRMEVEEFGAYAIEEYESMPSSFRKWVDDLVGAIKAWMFSRYGRQIGQVTPAQLRALAKDALITIALHRRGELFGPIAERFSTTRITETPAFKRWFGSSKVVDENGKPLVVYHGTASDFSEFSKKVRAKHIELPGFYFTPLTEYADRYAESAGREFRDEEGFIAGSEGANVMPVYLSLQNPAVIDVGGANAGLVAAFEIEEMIKSAQFDGHDGVILKGWADGSGPIQYVAFRPEQIKSAIGNVGTFDPENADIRYSVRPSEAFNDLNQSQKDFLDKIGPTSLPQRLRDRFDQLTDNLGLRIRQAGVDRYAALLRNDQALLGADTLEGSIASSSWVLARMSHAAGGAVSAMMDAGRIYLDPKEKVIDVREGTQGLAATLRSLGSPAEIDRFMGWIAANRANKLFKQGRENLFSHSEIQAGMKLSGGKLENGKSRSILYAKAWKELQQHRDDVLGIAEQAGLLKPAMSKPDAGLVIARKYEAPAAIIKQLTEAKNALDAARTPDMLNTAQQKVDMANDALLDWLNGAVQSMKIDMLNTPQDRLDAITQELDDLQRSQRELWSEEFYVPFYRVIDEDSIGGPRAGSGLSRQQAYKKLKGGKQHLNDLLDNTLLNFHHLIQASLKNQAAAQAMANAEALGIAEQTTEAKRDKKASTYVMIDGEKQWYDVSDPLTFKAVSALSSAGLNTPVMKVGRAFKRFFTNMTTITPQFVVANGLRDTLSAMATSPTSAVPFKTAFKGALTYWNDHNRARMMASGGAFSFGHVYGQNADEIKASLTVSMRKAKVLRDPKLIPGALLTAWRKYHAVTDFAENINRAGIWERNLEKGKLKAAFEARDLMDFSAHGDAIAIRILIDLVPFLNARIQGLDKLYRAGFKPGSKVAMGKGTKADRQAFARFMAVTGALTLASTLLFLNNYDDDEYRKLEDWQRDTYWIIRIGDEMFFIPKPFEVGAIATMGERLAEQFADPAVGGEKFAQRLGHMLTDTFAFDPTPQLVKPAVEVFWKNKDSFTGRPIEDQSMERLSPSLRSRPDTSRLADAASRGMEAAAGAVGGQDLALSPVQIDHLIRGYTGSVGATAVATADTLWRRAMGEELPARRWHEYQPIKRFYRDLTQEPTYTRYGTDFYEALKKADRAYADLMHLEKYGDEKRAAALAEEKAGELGMRKALNAVRRDLAKINADMKRIQLDKEMSGEAKRLELDRLRSLRNLITEQVGKDLEQEKIRKRAAAD